MEAAIGAWAWLSILSHTWEENLDSMPTCLTKFGPMNEATQYSGVIGDTILRFFFFFKAL